ncbi:hypothetical protein ACVWZV_007133 [Bradyrhizobium sp. GM5.1]
MPTERLSMRRIREVLRLRHQGLTERVIARTLGVSNGVVHGYVRRARLAGLTWPLPEGLDADSDEAGHAFQFEAGRVFRSEAGHPWRRSHGSIS